MGHQMAPRVDALLFLSIKDVFNGYCIVCKNFVNLGH